MAVETFSQKNRLIFVGCGTSYYLALSAASVFNWVSGAMAKAVPASDILFYPDRVDQGDATEVLGVVISRSGATTEALRAAYKIRAELRFTACAISCRAGSELVDACDFAVVAEAADEKSVVMTRSFTSMLLLIQRLAAVRVSNAGFRNELNSLGGLGASVMEKAGPLARRIVEHGGWSTFVYLGQGPYYGLACESMLKMKEMSLSVSESYHTLEYRHGPMSMVDSRMLITFFISDHGEKEETVLLKEMKKLGAKILAVCDKANDDVRAHADYLMELNSGLPDSARLVLCMPLVQLLALHWAVAKGLDPDQPKNLTQVVQIR
jgi:glucosamine--fructose-6-phosphate aminotransferase (isomerizing)